jgi:formylglycine-generating enzyme required for sulfatase activity/predicted Ser/Thr protein kinase
MPDGFAPDEYDDTIAERTVIADQFEVIRKLGEGGMGEVHLASDRLLDDRLVAIKTLPALRVASPRAMKQLRREAAAMLELTHEHIVRFFHFGEHRGLPFLVMQYIEGRTLDDLLDERETLGPAELIELMAPLAAALDYAHGKGVVHRDIKPGNIFIDEAGKPYLADFGVARVAKDTITQVTGRDLTSGTLMYMSPEQCRGAWDLTAATDIYSFATVLYECLSGRVPFSTGPIRELILQQEPPPLNVDHPMAKRVMDGLAKEQIDRPTSCVELLGVGPEQRVRVVELGRSPDEKPKGVQVDPPAELPSRPSHGDRFVNSIGMELVYIGPGNFMMGSPDGDGELDEHPRHVVTLTCGFYMGRTAVTQAQWKAVMGTNPSKFKGDDLPVEQVSWHDAMAFCKELSYREGRTYRLPMEAEWEYASRAGSLTRYYFGDAEEQLDRYAWYHVNSGGETHSVGAKAPNGWGFHDMYGNVWEWCQDWYGDYPSGTAIDPSGPPTGSCRLLRGGSWDDDANYCQSSFRFWSAPDYCVGYIGFRVCLDVK